MAQDERDRPWPLRVAHSLRSWLTVGHRDWPCPRCGTVVRAGQSQCVLCGHDFRV